MKHVCHACIKDAFLSDEVKMEATLAQCSYCRETREAITLAILAERFHETLREHFCLTPDHPDEPYEYYQASEGDWDRRGEPAQYVIMDMADIAEEVAADATKLLSDEYGYWAIREEGREDPYGFDARYEEKAPDVQYFQDAWTTLRAAKKSRKHLFSPATEAVLSEIFRDLETQSTILAQPVIRLINPGDADSRVWRGRTARSDGELEEILKHPAHELGPPPAQSAKSGRMNQEGVPVFYGAMDRSTCVSEIRAPVGSHVVVGKFELLRPVRLLDLDALANVHVKGSYFDPDYSTQTNRAAFLRRLVEEVSRPIMPQDEATEYLQTQVVAKYLAKKSCPPLDGILFRSSQTGRTGRNLVLFNHACSVEPWELPTGSKIDVRVPLAEEEDDSIEVFETTSEPDEEKPDKPKPTSLSLIRSLIQFVIGNRRNRLGFPSNPTLRLDENSVGVLDIKSVAYDFGDRSVSRHRQTQKEWDDLVKQFSHGSDVDIDTLLEL